MKYIATFFSHFGAVQFRKSLEALAVPAKASPVPRSLSSSCGTCVYYEADAACPLPEIPEDVEQIAEVLENGYHNVYKA